MDEAEALCDRVAVMQDGRILDTGTPQELVDRHGRWARLRFTSSDAPVRAASLACLPGVTGVTVNGRAVEVHGNRAMIAHVGARLAADGDVPDDLWVSVPDLEDAVLHLLDASSALIEVAA
jgi:ABC-2 type transport system ATP-binding protein